jgi:UrcA family protein
MFHMYSRSVISGLALAVLVGPLTAHGAAIVTTDGTEPVSRVVHFNDLNLDSRAGVATLYTRLRSAAKEVCEPERFSTSISYLRERHCQDKAIGQAVAEVRSAQLTTFHMSKSGSAASTQTR